MAPRVRKQRTHPVRVGVSGLAALTLCTLAWAWLGPAALGGHFSVFTIVGDSMEPSVTAGDLALLREQERYGPGDLVAYRDPDLGTVLHRIVAIDGPRHVLRGDNRQVDDSYRPTHDEIQGQAWQIVPRGGDVLAAIQTPELALLLTVASFVGIIGARPRFGARRWQHGERRRQPLSQSSPTGGSPVTRSPLGDRMLALGSGALLGGLLLGVVLWIEGPTERTRHDVAVEHAGAFDYSGAAGRGVYDGDTIETGQPIFLEIGTSLPVEFHYELTPLTTTAEVSEVEGTIRLLAEISQDNGWRRRVEISPPQPFVGTEGSAAGTLDLQQLLDFARRMETLSGLSYPLYPVRIVAEVAMTGRVDDAPIVETFRSPLDFTLTPQQLIPGVNFSATSTDPSMVMSLIEEPWTLTLPFVDIDVEHGTLRFIALLLASAGVIAIAFVMLVTRSIEGRGEVALIRARYAQYIVSAAAADVVFAGRQVQVSHIEDLVRIARQDGLFIVHAADSTADHFLLVLPDVTYSYTVTVPSWVNPGLAPPDNRDDGTSAARQRWG